MLAKTKPAVVALSERIKQIHAECEALLTKRAAELHAECPNVPLPVLRQNLGLVGLQPCICRATLMELEGN